MQGMNIADSAEQPPSAEIVSSHYIAQIRSIDCEKKLMANLESGSSFERQAQAPAGFA
jgi:hypothetical protein